MAWLRKTLSIFGLSNKETGDVAWADRTAASPAADGCNDILAALTQSGLAQGRPEDMRFVRAALHGEEWPKGATLRRHGRPLSTDELRARGYRANLVLSHECFETLTAKGREDPVEATQFIVSALLQRRSVAERVAQARAVLGEKATIQILPNNMATGPCEACLALSKRPIPLAMAPRGPLPECPHASQCVLHWRLMSDVGE